MRYFGILCLSVLVLFSACNKEGCTDELASNKTNGAKKDDGSCVYESSVVFWHNSTTKSVMSSNGISTLNYYLDGTQLGSSDVNTVFTSAPDCLEPTAFIRQIAYDENPEKTLSYEVKSQTGAVVFSGSINFSNRVCVPQELAY